MHFHPLNKTAYLSIVQKLKSIIIYLALKIDRDADDDDSALKREFRVVAVWRNEPRLK